MLKCPHCQSENLDDAQFCANCGNRLTAADFTGIAPTADEAPPGTEQPEAVAAVESVGESRLAREGRMSMQQKGFFASLFDFSFSSMVTTKIIKILYTLAVIGMGLLTISWIAAAFAASETAGVIVLVLSPLIFILMVTIARMYLEAVIVLFKIAENTATIAENTKRTTPSG